MRPKSSLPKTCIPPTQPTATSKRPQLAWQQGVLQDPAWVVVCRDLRTGTQKKDADGPGMSGHKAACCTLPQEFQTFGLKLSRLTCRHRHRSPGRPRQTCSSQERVRITCKLQTQDLPAVRGSACCVPWPRRLGSHLQAPRAPETETASGLSMRSRAPRSCGVKLDRQRRARVNGYLAGPLPLRR